MTVSTDLTFETKTIKEAEAVIAKIREMGFTGAYSMQRNSHIIQENTIE